MYPPANVQSDLPEHDLQLVRALAPVIRFGANEPFLPHAVGITFLDKPGKSASSPRDISFETGVARVIEYAIWWDWDIQHLYELEHIWLKLDSDDRVVAVTASAHGGQYDMALPDGSLPVENGRVTLYSEPGKHAFHPTAASMENHRAGLAGACSTTTLYGFSRGHILINGMFRDAFDAFTPEDHRAVRRYLQSRAFVPSFDFSQRFDLADVAFTDWPGLHAYITRRVPEVLAHVRSEQPLLKAVFVDSGDTLVDESSEVRDANDIVVDAELIPGVPEMIQALTDEGYRLVLVADGRVLSFENVLGKHGIWQHFEAQVISENVGQEKPHAVMFEAALTAADLSPQEAGQTVMIGNNLSRDIAGANQAGIISIWQNWSPRRSKQPATEIEVPDHMVRSPGELPKLLETIELQMARAVVRERLKPAR